MKKEVHFSLVSEIPIRVYDQSAETIKELAAACGRSVDWVRDYATKEVEAGRWERVWKKANRQIAPAYRRKTTKTND